MRFCLELQPHVQISPSHFRKINWLPFQSRVNLRTSTTLFKYWKGIAPSYRNNIYIPSVNNYNTKSQMALNIWLFRTNEGQKNMSLLGPVIWNELILNIKTAATSTSFTHGLKKPILEELR